VIARSADVMAASGREDLFELGAVPLAVLQKYINYWYTEALDLFGGEDSSNAATWFAAGLKGRFQEEDQPEHLALDQVYELRKADGTVETIAMRRAMNAVLRDAFVKDCQRGLKRWNRELEHRKLDARIYLPAISFNRKVGALAAIPCDPAGAIISHEEFERRRGEWLPTEEDRLRVAALMKPVYEPGKIASWLTPPVKGVGGKPALDFEYVRFD
jgi:benzoyl-CoA 2,3-dioxygenase component B